MNLQLRMIKTPEGASLPQQQFSFDQHGGTIGRGPDNHWVLPDPDRILSARHCEFTVEQGRFQLIDHSTNGTFINGSSEPLGKGVVTTINHGDQVEIGDYTFAIDLLNAEAGSLDASPFATEPAPEEHPATPFSVDDPFACDPFDAGPVADPSRDSLDPLQMLDGASGTEREPWHNESSALYSGPGEGGFSDSEPKWQDPSVDAIHWPEAHQEQLIPTDWLEPVGREPDSASPKLDREPEWAAAPQPTDAQLWDEPAGHDDHAAQEIPGPVVTPQPGKRPSPDRPTPVSRAEPVEVTSTQPSADSMPPRTSETLFSAMGVDLDRLSPEARVELEPLIGTMMREVIEGLMQVLRSRASIKNEFRMNVTTIQPVENNPLKFSADVDEALENIFVRRSQAYKEPLQAIREGFQEIAEHQLAMISGMRRAFEHMLKEFDPDRFEANANSQQKPSVIPPVRKARYWDNYRAHYRGLSDNMERSFQQIFGDEFVQAYQDQLRRLSALRP